MTAVRQVLEFYSDDQPRDENGRFATGDGGGGAAEKYGMTTDGKVSVDKLLADNPQHPGEAVFEYQARIVAGLTPQQKSDVLFHVRERYPASGFIVEGARKYCEQNGLAEPVPHVIANTPCNLAEGEAVARYFETAKDQSDDPRVQQAYQDFKDQSQKQWDYMTKPESEGGMGVNVTFAPYSAGDPYPSAEAQRNDLEENHHITIQSGLGGAHDLTMSTPEYDRFRAVHDVFGHAGVGGGFDRHGEYEAWLMHAAMYTGLGQQAMSTEYHGVNSALWGGAPGTPGTGMSILLPERYAEPPWERPLTAAASESWAQELARKLGLDDTFASKFEDVPWHPHYGDEDVMVAAGNPDALRQWFEDDPDGRIRWGEDGDFGRCVDIASGHMSDEDAKGFCNLRHQGAVGEPPGKGHDMASTEERITALEASVLAIARLELGDSPGHPFRGNQHTASESQRDNEYRADAEGDRRAAADGVKIPTGSTVKSQTSPNPDVASKIAADKRDREDRLKGATAMARMTTGFGTDEQVDA